MRARVVRPEYSAVTAAVAALSVPIRFGSGQGAANALLAKMATVVCHKCAGAGKVPGKTKPCKCSRCHGVGRGFAFAGTLYWTGHPAAIAAPAAAV